MSLTLSIQLLASRGSSARKEIKKERQSVEKLSQARSLRNPPCGAGDASSMALTTSADTFVHADVTPFIFILEHATKFSFWRIPSIMRAPPNHKNEPHPRALLGLREALQSVYMQATPPQPPQTDLSGYPRHQRASLPAPTSWELHGRYPHVPLRNFLRFRFQTLRVYNLRCN